MFASDFSTTLKLGGVTGLKISVARNKAGGNEICYEWSGPTQHRCFGSLRSDPYPITTQLGVTYLAGQDSHLGGE